MTERFIRNFESTKTESFAILRNEENNTVIVKCKKNQ